MRIRRLAPWVLGAVLLAPARAAPAEPGGARLHGSVREPDGRPSTGRVVVTPSVPAGPSRTVILAADGTFSVEVPPRATVTVEAATEAGDALRVYGVGLPRAAALDLRWPADLGRLRGTVVDPARVPVAGAQVRSWTEVAHGVFVDATRTTGADGAFAMRAHPDGFVRVEAPGFTVASKRVPAGDAPLTVRLRREGPPPPVVGLPGAPSVRADAAAATRPGAAAAPGAGLGALEVRVLAADGAPIGEAAVRVGTGEAGAWGTTGDDGVALVEGVPAGEVTVWARPFGAVAWSSASVTLPSGATARAPAVVRVEARATIAGVLRFADGRARTNVRVFARGPLRPSHRVGGAELEGAVRLDGTFVVAGLEPGRYEVTAATAWGPGQASGTQEVEAGARGVAVTLAPTPREVPATRSLEVLVVGPDGAPVPYAVGQVQFEGHGIGVFEVEEGLAILEADGPTVSLRVRGARDAHGVPLPFGPREVRDAPARSGSLTLTLPPERRIEGRVVGADGRGLEGVEVHAQVPGPDAYTAFHVPDAPAHVTTTDATGAFVLRQLGDRAHDVEVPGTRGFLPSAERGVTPGATGLVVVRRPSVDAVVTVVDVRGRPVVGATVRWPVAGPPSPEAPPDAAVLPWAYVPPEAETDASGRVRCLDLDPDALYALAAFPPQRRGDLLATQRGAWRAADVTLTLGSARSVAGVVRSPDGAPIPWAQVHVTRDGDTLGSDEVDGEGRFLIDGLPEGSVEVRATLLGVSGAGSDYVRATVETGAQDVVLVADPGPTLVVRAEGAAFPGTPDRARVGGGWTEARLFDQGPDGATTYGHVERGALVFRRLRPGRPYTLWIPWTREAGGTFLEQGTSLVVGERTVVLDPGAPIAGTVDLTRVRSPIPSNIGRGGADWVVARRGIVQVRLRLGDAPDAGDFAFPPLPSGRWTVLALVRDADRGLLEATTEVEAGSKVVLVPAPRPAR